MYINMIKKWSVMIPVWWASPSSSSMRAFLSFLLIFDLHPPLYSSKYWYQQASPVCCIRVSRPLLDVLHHRDHCLSQLPSSRDVASFLMRWEGKSDMNATTAWLLCCLLADCLWMALDAALYYDRFSRPYIILIFLDGSVELTRFALDLRRGETKDVRSDGHKLREGKGQLTYWEKRTNL